MCLQVQRWLGRVCAVMRGIDRELVQVPAFLDGLGKRVNKALADHKDRLRKLTEKTKQAIFRLKRLKCNEAEREAKKAAAEAQLQADCEELASRPTAVLEHGRVEAARDPAAASCCSGAATGSSTALVTHRSDTDAAALLINMVGGNACSRCYALQKEKMEARKRAEDAEEARRLADESAARAWAERQITSNFHDEQARELEARHAAALELQKETQLQALQEARRARTQAQEEVERLRARVVVAQGHQSTLSINSWQTVQAERTAQKHLQKAKQEIVDMTEKLTAQQAVAKQQAQEAQKRHDQQMQREREQLGEKLRQVNVELSTLKASAASNTDKYNRLQSELHGERVRRGNAERALQRVDAGNIHSSTSRSGRGGGGTSERTEVQRLHRALAAKDEHIQARDALLEELRDKLREAAAREGREAGDRRREQQQRQGEGQAASSSQQQHCSRQRIFNLRSIRNRASGNSPLEPSSMDIIRRLIDEANISFSAVPKCVALVWALITNDEIPEELLICRATAVNAYLRLEQLDAIQAAKKRKEADAPWAFASDGGNKGTAVNLVAISHWDFDARQPRLEPLTLSSLNSDQTARNCADTVNAAIATSGLNPRRCVAGMTDGCEAAQQEASLVLQEQHRRYMQLEAAAGETQLQPQRSRAETCAIHGKALEERAFLEEAFPLVVDALRILWEVMKGDGVGRVNEYREIWVNKCKFPPQTFESAFVHVPEFTLAKWGCMREGCQALVAVIQRPRRGTRSLIERFLEKCREIFNGTIDETKATRSEHPHREKINVLSGLFKEGTLHASIYAINDMWDKRYDAFFKFCKSPALFGGFAPPHLRHMMAEQVATDKVYYENARADPVRAQCVLHVHP